MGLMDCIRQGLRDKVITQEQAERAEKIFRDFEKQPGNTSSTASQQAYEAIEREVFQRRRRVLQQAQAQEIALENIGRFKGDDDGEALISLLERDGSGRSPYSNVVSRQAALRGMAHAMMDDVITSLKKSAVLGRTTRAARATSTNMVRELFGEATGDAAAQGLAKAWTNSADFLRKAFNAAGGDIPELATWGLPQVHNNAAVRRAGREEWKRIVLPLLDRDETVSFQTGAKFTQAELDEVLDEVWETIATEGFSKVKETAAGGRGKSLARRRVDHRFLHFKDADSWLRYSDAFGDADPFTTMMNHVDGMSRDVALLETLGPNPNHTVSFLKTQLEKRAKKADAAAGTDKASQRLTSKLNTFDELYDAITGRSYAPVNERIARTFSGLGNMLTAAYLGSTSLLALMTDSNFTRITKRMAGMPVFRSAMARTLKMVAAKKTTKAQAVRLGLIAENWSSVAYGQARYAHDVLGGKVSEAIAHTAMNVSLLSPFTQAGRWAFGMEFMGFLADNVKTPYKALSRPLRDTLDRYGVTAKDWSKMRSVKLYEHKGAKFFRPDEMLDTNRELAFKVLEMVQGMTNLAVPVSSLRARTALVGGTKAGTLVGEVARSFAMFKNFPVTFYLNNVKAALYQKGPLNKAAIAGDLLITSTAMAVLANQLREISKGRDPMDMTMPEVWGKGLLTGGGLGIYGDFLFEDLNRFGGGMTETIAGPRASFLNDLRNLTIGNAAELVRGEKTNAARETVDFFGRNLPGVSTWYLRLVIERSILDRLRLMADPKAEQRFKRLERRFIKEYDQEYWWRPGEAVPERAPNIGAAVQ